MSESKPSLYQRARKATRDRYRKLFRKSRIKGGKVSRHENAGRFRDQSGTAYQRHPNGVIIRAEPKPYQGKKQAKLYKKLRRQIEL